MAKYLNLFYILTNPLLVTENSCNADITLTFLNLYLVSPVAKILSSLGAIFKCLHRNFIGVGPIFYSCGKAVIRYLYVRSSFEVNIHEVLKRDSFIFKSLFIGECVNLFNLGSFYFQREDSEFGRSPLVL